MSLQNFQKKFCVQFRRFCHAEIGRLSERKPGGVYQKINTPPLPPLHLGFLKTHGRKIYRYNRPMSSSSISSSAVVVTCKGVLFDMDGILISSLGSVERSWTKWAEMRDLDPGHVLSIIHGRRAIESIIMLRPDLDSVKELRLIEE